MINLNRLLIVLLILCSNYVLADPASGGVQVKILSNMYAQQLEQFKTMIDQLEELKAASEMAKDTVRIMGDLQEEYYFVTNFNLDNEVNRIIGNFADLTYLDELSNAQTPEARYNLIRAEIDRRFKNENISGRDKKELEELRRRLAALEAYEVMRNKYLQEVLKPTAVSDKDMQARQTSSSSILAAIALEEQLERKKAELLAKEKVVDQVKWDSEFLRYLKRDN